MQRKDFSMPGALMIVISQVISSFHSSENISGEIEKFRKEFQQSIVDRETFFVRKTELASIANKIDQLNIKVITIHEQIKSLKVYIYSQKEDETFVGCAYHPTMKRGL